MLARIYTTALLATLFFLLLLPQSASALSCGPYFPNCILHFAGQKTLTSTNVNDYNYWNGIGGAIRSYNPDLGSGDTSLNRTMAWVMADQNWSDYNDCGGTIWAQAGTWAGNDPAGAGYFHISPYSFYQYCADGGGGQTYTKSYKSAVSGSAVKYYIKYYGSHPTDPKIGRWAIYVGAYDSAHMVQLVNLSGSRGRMSASGEVQYQKGTCCPAMNSHLGEAAVAKLLLKTEYYTGTWTPWDGYLPDGRKTGFVATCGGTWFESIVTNYYDFKILWSGGNTGCS